MIETWQEANKIISRQTYLSFIESAWQVFWLEPVCNLMSRLQNTAIFFLTSYHLSNEKGAVPIALAVSSVVL